MATPKTTVKLSQSVFQGLIERGMNKQAIKKELGITMSLVDQAFERWGLKCKKTSNIVEWEDNATEPENTPVVTSEPVTVNTVTKDESTGTFDTSRFEFKEHVEIPAVEPSDEF